MLKRTSYLLTVLVRSSDVNEWLLAVLICQGQDGYNVCVTCVYYARIFKKVEGGVGGDGVVWVGG